MKSSSTLSFLFSQTIQIFLWVQKHWFMLTMIIWAAIAVTSLLPLDQIQMSIMEVSEEQYARLPPEQTHIIPGSDKTHHVIAYSLLMLPTALRGVKYWWLMALAFIGFSGVIELIQPFVYRSAEWLDLLANSCGVAVGALLGALLNKIIKINR